MGWFTSNKKNIQTKEEAEQEKRNANTPNCECEVPEAESLTFQQLLGITSHGNKTLSAVYACLELISSSLASIPLRVVKQDVNGHQTVVNHHPLQKIFRNKNYQTMSMYMTIKNMVLDVLQKGNGYIYINRLEENTVTSLRWISASDVTIQYDENKDTLYYLIPKITTKKILPKDIIHISKNTSSDGMTGISVLSYAKDVLDLARSAEASAKEFFASGMNINGILSCNTMLNDKQRQDIRSSWQQGGGKTSLQVLPANVTYQQIGTDASKAQLLESRQHETIEIARYFNVPIQMIQAGDKLTYNKLEEFNLLYLQHTLSPYMTSIEQEFTRKLFPGEDDLYVDFDENFYLLRTDKASTADYLSKLVTSGIISVNEARTELGLPEIEGAGKLTVSFTDVQQNTIAEEKKSKKNLNKDK